MNQVSQTVSDVQQAVDESSAYPLIRKRLIDQATQLQLLAQNLNGERQLAFGQSDISLVQRAHVHTQHNCLARDIVRVGPYLLLGYNVKMGLQRETLVSDVFSLYRYANTSLSEDEATYQLDIKPVSLNGTFLQEPEFLKSFTELYAYYKNARLLQLMVKDDQLMATFQIGGSLQDCRVFRWKIEDFGSANCRIHFIDNRGNVDVEPPSTYDFKWVQTGRADIVQAQLPHIIVADTLFVDVSERQLRVRIEDNTQSGVEIYAAPVEDATQSLSDVEIWYAVVTHLIVFKVLPYRETQWRFFIYNPLTQTIERCDELEQAAQCLPGDQGLIFPGGMYVREPLSGNECLKRFDQVPSGYQFKKYLKAPNGEDHAFLFYEPQAGVVLLYAYNSIQRTLKSPLSAHGYAFFENGLLLLFTAETETTRLHPIQIWKTSFTDTSVIQAKTISEQGYLEKIGNAALVSGISDFFSVSQLACQPDADHKQYQALNQYLGRFWDQYFWLEWEEFVSLKECLQALSGISEQVLAEYDKVKAIAQQSEQTLNQAILAQQQLIPEVQSEAWTHPEQFAAGLQILQQQQGRLLGLKSLRYVDLNQIELLEEGLQSLLSQLEEETLGFLLQPHSFEPYDRSLVELKAELAEAQTSVEMKVLIPKIDEMTSGLEVLTELMNQLTIEDPTQSAKLIDQVGLIYAQCNQLKALAKQKLTKFGVEESGAQFSAQLKLYQQNIANALSLAVTPESTDEQLALVLTRLEGLESQFGDLESFSVKIFEQRDLVYETFESHKQQLLEQRQNRVKTIFDSANRLLVTLKRRVETFSDIADLNTFMASDSMMSRLQSQVLKLQDLKDSVKAQSVLAQIKAIKEQSFRVLRDKSDLYYDSGKAIRLGKHKFSVNSQELELTLLLRDSLEGTQKNTSWCFHLVGTDFHENIPEKKFSASVGCDHKLFVSESEVVYRSEYLAYQLLFSCVEAVSALPESTLGTSSEELDQIIHQRVNDYCQSHHSEGYQKGIHDHDAKAILYALIPVVQAAGLLQFPPKYRALAILFWQSFAEDDKNSLKQKARSSFSLQEKFSSASLVEELSAKLQALISDFCEQQLSENSFAHVLQYEFPRVIEYLLQELHQDTVMFIRSSESSQLCEAFQRECSGFDVGSAENSFEIVCYWLEGFVESRKLLDWSAFIPEAAIQLIASTDLGFYDVDVSLLLSIEGLVGTHCLIQNQVLTLRLDDFIQKCHHHCEVVVPNFHQHQLQRQELLQQKRHSLQLSQYQAEPLSSFIRNQLIDTVYLPLIGDNLAKQMGALGEAKRTDLMGLLMLISPPGYGKTTLMEYVANRLGLVFVKVNGPSLGHGVVSLDPAHAPNATAAHELVKLNFAFEMANNVMLYIDDIQHTHPEFLQKFISLCDGSRKIEGVWSGQTKTYDLRGKQFCIVMAGNPYTETGEVFTVPDMLSNRADIYNLGDILGGSDDVFALSYLENCLTSNVMTAALATRDLKDIYAFIDLAQGKENDNYNFSYPYAAAEVTEIVTIFKHLLVIQKLVLQVNQMYVSSAAIADTYRVEPSFKLQGSYRNMSKMAEKVSSAMNDAELQLLIDDHYKGESQLLTEGAEENWLKLLEIRGRLTDSDAERWQVIKSDFLRNKAMGSRDDDVGMKVVAQLRDIVEAYQKLLVLGNSVTNGFSHESVQPSIEIINPPAPELLVALSSIAKTFETGLIPLVKSMEKKLDIDLNTHNSLMAFSRDIQELKEGTAIRYSK